MKDSLLQKLKTSLNMDEIGEDTAFSEFDSFSLAEIILIVEEECGIEFSGKQILSLKTFGDLDAFLKEEGVEA